MILFISCTFYWVFLAGKCISCRVSVYRFHRKLTASGPYRVCLAWGTWPGHPCLRSDWLSSQLASSSLGLPTQSRPRGQGVDKSLSTGASPCYGISVKMLEAIPPKRAGPSKVTPPPQSPGGPACVQVLGEGAQWGGMGLWRGKRRLMRSLEEVPEPSGNSWELGGPIPSFWCLKLLICKWKKGPAFLASRP